jgi:hypothetical protein
MMLARPYKGFLTCLQNFPSESFIAPVEDEALQKSSVHPVLFSS